MKKVLLAVVAIAITAVLSVAVVDHYRSYQAEQAIKTARIQAIKDNGLQQRIDSLSATNTKIKTQFNALVVECEKGKVAYEELTTIQKKQTQIPTCSTPIK